MKSENKDMRRTKLINARLNRQWTVEHAAEEIGVGINTLIRWEHGPNRPFAYNVRKICNVYGTAASELDLEDECYPDIPEISATTEELAKADEMLRALIRRDLTLRLLKIPWTWPRSNTAYYELQARIRQETEDYRTMNHEPNEPVTRRDALRRLALLPIETRGLTLLGTASSYPAEEILPFCATGVAACWQLAKGRDLSLTNAILSAYVPTLTSIARQPSHHQKAAANLAAQTYILKGILGFHLERLSASEAHFQNALMYSNIAEDPILITVSLEQQAVTCYYDKRPEEALAKSKEAAASLSNMPPLVRSFIYSHLSTYQAQCGQKQDALRALGLAQDYFSRQSTDNNSPIYLDYGSSNLTLYEGSTHYALGLSEKQQDKKTRYLKAFESFKQVEALSPLRGTSERTRIQLLNSRALAALRLNEMDEFLNCMKIAIPGTAALGSKLRLAEQRHIFELMEFVWSGESRIDELKEMFELHD